ncbi:unnamed protein product [Cunninghamella blakesleeana]
MAASVISTNNNSNNNSYVTAQLILDENRPYFAGEIIRGKATFISTRPVSPHGIRLIWAGGVTIRPTVMEHENLLYFKKTYAVSNEHLAGKKGSNGVIYKSAFVEDQVTTSPLLLIMEEAITYTFHFEVKVPVDDPLPSSTSAEQAIVGGKIVYSIECCLDLVENDPSPVKAHSIVTVLELIDVRDPKVATPVTEESVYALWLNGTPRTNPCDFKTAMRAQLPLRACTRGGELTILIHVWHSVEFQRAKGVTVSLVRVRQVHYHGSAYAFPDEVIFSMRADVDIKQEKRYVQALSCNIKIPSDITPSITGSAKLLDVSYKILMKVQLQDGIYQTPSGDVSHFMFAEIPLLIGTVPLIVGKKVISPPAASKKGSIRAKNPPTAEPSKETLVDNGSVGSVEGKKRERSFRNFIKIPGWSRGKRSDKDKDKDKDSQEDDKSVHRHSGVSVPKSDLGYRNSLNNGSQGSHSTGSPRIESVPTNLESPLATTKAPNPFQVTDSSVELKPDEKDGITLDFELLDAVKKSMADGHVLTDVSNSTQQNGTLSTSSTTAATTAAATATYVSPSGVRTVVQLDKKNTEPSPSSPTQQTSSTDNYKVKDSDHKQEPFPQSPISAPATVTSNNEQNKGDNGVIYHDIFESSDEEYDDDDDYHNNDDDNDKNNIDQNNNNNNEDNVKYHDIFGSDDENDDEDDEYPKKNNHDNENIKFGEEIVKPSEDQRHLSQRQLSQHQNTPPSPPLHENDKKSWNQNNNNNNDDGENSDSDDDSSPLNVMLKYRNNTNTSPI